MTILIGDILRASAHFASDAVNNAMNVYHFRVTEADDIPEQTFLNRVSDDMAAIYNLTLAGNIVNNVNSTGLFWARWNSSTNTWEDLGQGDFTTAFFSTADMAPHGVAGLVRFAGEGGGRRGRKFIYGLGEDCFTDGIIDFAVQVGLAIFGSLMADPIGDSGAMIYPIIWRGGGSFRDMTGVADVAGVAAYQRRRKPGVGW